MRLLQRTITPQIHSDFKYSMNWECPDSHRPNLCLMQGSATESGWNGHMIVESCSECRKHPLETFDHFCDSPAVFVTCCLKVLCSTPAALFPSPPLYLHCISVRKCLRTFHGIERQRKTLINLRRGSTYTDLRPDLTWKDTVTLFRVPAATWVFFLLL